MKKIITLLSLVFFHLIILAQNCTDESVKTLPGKWKPGMKGSSDHSSADMVKEKALMDDIIQTIRDNFKWSPVGGEITYGNAYSIRGLDYRPLAVIKICHQYHPYVFYQHYFCGWGKPMLEDFAVEVNVNINDIPFRFESSYFQSKTDKFGHPLEPDPETDMYGFTGDLPVQKNGLIDYTKANIGSSLGDVTKKYRVLAKPGQLPYRMVSKKENYEKCKIRSYKKIADYEYHKTNAVAEGKPEKSFLEWSDQQIASEKEHIEKIDKILNSKSSEVLAGPAFSGEERGEFYEATTSNNSLNYIIAPNLAYYNNQLPKSSPQVITIEFMFKTHTDKYGDKTYADEGFYNELDRMKIIDLLTEKLQPLIAQ